MRVPRAWWCWSHKTPPDRLDNHQACFATATSLTNTEQQLSVNIYQKLAMLLKDKVFSDLWSMSLQKEGHN